ncbi:hypothetical protein [Alkalihalobacterium elongatum]|uniref:hypothetical protein n=1 Tax=Alkalihalobacterium elongatum TaxID=2675466 RepID=UPI001C2006EC|nr:hypothetical protein [Alkalihalobacterium elongatum]
MDRTLVEKITRMVIEKLEEHSSYRPLSKEEINKWDEISSVFETRKTVESTVEVNSPLSERELRRWSEITASLEKKKEEAITSAQNTNENNLIRFNRYN